MAEYRMNGENFQDSKGPLVSTVPIFFPTSSDSSIITNSLSLLFQRGYGSRHHIQLVLPICWLNKSGWAEGRGQAEEAQKPGREWRAENKSVSQVSESFPLSRRRGGITALSQITWTTVSSTFNPERYQNGLLPDLPTTVTQETM